MRKLGIAVVFGHILFGALAAHAAPPAAPGPSPSVVRAPSAPIVLLGTVTAEILPGSPNVCGQPQKVRVKLANTTKEPWSGMINFVPAMRAVSLGPAGSQSATRVYDVDGSVLDCKKPLAPQGVRVWKNGAESTPIFTKTLKPKSVEGFVPLPPPAAASAHPWIRSAEIKATCDGPVNARVHIQGGSVQEPIQLKLTFGIYVSSPNVVVPPNRPTIVSAIVPKPLDCSAGIPAFDYGLVNPPGSIATLEIKEVTFE